MKLNDFTVECKIIFVVFLVGLVRAVGKKPPLAPGAAVLAGLWGRRGLLHPTPTRASPTTLSACPDTVQAPGVTGGAGDGLIKHPPESPHLGYLMWKH